MNITSGTIARTIILALALINQILSASGHAILPIEDETVEALVSAAATVITAVIAWWKNNSFTLAARKGDERMWLYKEHKRLTGEDYHEQ